MTRGHFLIIQGHKKRNLLLGFCRHLRQHQTSVTGSFKRIVVASEYDQNISFCVSCLSVLRCVCLNIRAYVYVAHRPCERARQSRFHLTSGQSRLSQYAQQMIFCIKKYPNRFNKDQNRLNNSRT